MGIKNYIGKLRNKFVSTKRAKFNAAKRKKLKNFNPTIISINCIGSIIYHNLGLRFNSPTINLFMKQSDYIKFLDNLTEFLSENVELNQIFIDGYDYPIGELKNGNLSVTLYFMHYKTFEDAKLKWMERSKRINFDNLFIIWEYQDRFGPDQELWEKFKALKYKNKVLITGKDCPIDDDDVLKMNIYDSKYVPGKILEYRRGLYFYKRYLDKFDYVKFLNKNTNGENNV